MMARRRRTKRSLEIAKRCSCDDRDACDHHWWLRVYANGKRQRVNLTERFPGEPVKVAAARAKDLARKGLLFDVLRPDARLTFGDVADRYVAARGNRKHHYLAGLREMNVPAANGTTVKLEFKPIDEVTTADIKHCLALWRTRKTAKAGVQQGQVAERHLIAQGRHLFTWANDEGFTIHSPFYSVQGKPLIHVKTTKARKRRLEVGEEERILAAADPYIADFFTAMIETGCRPGELRTLQWSEVKDDHFVVIATKAKDREDRDITITPDLEPILTRRRLGPDGQPLAPDAFVFGNETGDLISRRKLCSWLATLERAKVKDLHLHDLRREHATQLSEAGVSVTDIRNQLGHSNITMTNTYLGRSRDQQAKAQAERTAMRRRQAMQLAHVGQSMKEAKSS